MRLKFGFHSYGNKRISFKQKVQLPLYSDMIIVAYKHTVYKKQESKDSKSIQ